MGSFDGKSIVEDEWNTKWWYAKTKSDRRGTKVGINLLFVYNGEEGCERMKNQLELVSEIKPGGDQPEAIR